MGEQDNVWKEIIDGYFPQFIEFFFPPIFAEIDWSKPYETLDKELEKIVRDSEIGRRLVDKLVKVWLKGGQAICLLIHIEVQGYPDVTFEERMYIYNYRIFDRYKMQVISLAVLTDPDPDFRPKAYRQEFWGFRLEFEFPIIKLLDYNRDWAALEANLNPFAIMVMAQLKVIELRKAKTSELLNWKLRLVRMLYQRGYERQEIINLFRFIDWLVKLPIELEQQFQDELRKEEGEKMPYVSTIERWAAERAHQEGLEQGLEQGREEGREDGKLNLLLSLIRHKVGELEPASEERVRQLGSSQWDELSVALFEFSTQADLQNWLEKRLPSQPEPN